MPDTRWIKTWLNGDRDGLPPCWKIKWVGVDHARQAIVMLGLDTECNHPKDFNGQA